MEGVCPKCGHNEFERKEYYTCKVAFEDDGEFLQYTEDDYTDCEFRCLKCSHDCDFSDMGKIKEEE